jgi:hypothetical protein
MKTSDRMKKRGFTEMECGICGQSYNVINLALRNGAWDEDSDDETDSRDEVVSVLMGIDYAIAKAEGK